jgi:hypothetical protein
LRSIRLANDSPRHQQALFLCPFDDGYLDRLMGTICNGRRYLVALKRGGDPSALERKATVVDRA